MSRRPGRPLVLPLHALLELLEHLSVALGLLLFVKLFQILLGVVLKVGFVNYVVTLGVALVLLRLIVEEVVVLILFCLFAFSPEVYGPEILFLPIFLLLGCTLVLLPHELSLGCQHLSSCASVIHQLVSLHRSIVSLSLQPFLSFLITFAGASANVRCMRMCARVARVQSPGSYSRCPPFSGHSHFFHRLIST